MDSLFQIQSHFASAFIFTLLHSIWIGALMFLLMKLILSILRNSNASGRYYLSVAILLMFFLSIVGLFLNLYHPEQSSVSKVMKLLTLDDINAFKDKFGKLSSHMDDLSFLKIVLLLYFTGIAAFTLRTLLSYISVRRIIGKSHPADEGAVKILDQLARRLGITKRVRLVVSHKDESPALFGFLKPVIIVPVGIFTNLSFKQVETILMHELIHLRNFDFLVNIFRCIMEIIFFFNPFLWMMSRIMRQEMEMYCDDCVLKHTGNPGDYAKALLNLSLLQTDKKHMMLAASGADHQQLHKRIQKILNHKNMKQQVKSRLLSVVLLTLGFAVIFTMSGFRNALFTIERSSDNPVVQTNNALIYTLAESSEINQASIISEVTQQTQNTIEDLLSGRNDPASAQPDTITEEQRQEMIASLEEALKELKSIDWEEKMAEIEEIRMEVLADLPERLKEEQIRLQMEIKRIDEDDIRAQMEEIRQQMDSIKANVDIEKIEAEINAVHEKLEEELREKGISEAELHKQLEDAMDQLEQIDIQELKLEMEVAMEDFDFDADFDFDYDIDINVDSIMKDIRIEMKEIDIDFIRDDVQRSIEEIEEELNELKSTDHADSAKK